MQRNPTDFVPQIEQMFNEPPLPADVEAAFKAFDVDGNGQRSASCVAVLS